MGGGWMGGFAEERAELDISASISLTFSSYYLHLFFLCLHGAVPLDVPEEPLHELLLLRLSVVEDGNGDGGGVVLVFGQADGGDLLGGLLVSLGAVEGLQVLQKLGLCADSPLGPVSTLEEDHLASEHPGDGPPVQGGGGPALGEFVTVLVGGGDLLSPFGVRGGSALGVPGESSLWLLGSQGSGVPVHVDLHVLGQLAGLLEDAGQVAHGVVLEVLVVVDLLEVLVEVILVHIKQTLACVPL